MISCCLKRVLEISEEFALPIAKNLDRKNFTPDKIREILEMLHGHLYNMNIELLEEFLMETYHCMKHITSS